MVRPKLLFNIPRAFTPSSVHPDPSTADAGLHILTAAHPRRNLDSFSQNASQSGRSSINRFRSRSDDEAMYCNENYSIGTTEVLAFNVLEENQLNSPTQNNLRTILASKKGSFRAKLQSFEAGKRLESQNTDRNVHVLNPHLQASLSNSQYEGSRKFERNDFGCETTNIIRKVCMQLSGWKWFERIIMLTTLVHSSLVIFQAKHDFPIFVDIGFAAFFTFESFIHIVALGFLNGPRSYIHSSIFNRISFAVTLCNWAEVFAILRL